jgi:hypothetical protein
MFQTLEVQLVLEGYVYRKRMPKNKDKPWDEKKDILWQSLDRVSRKEYKAVWEWVISWIILGNKVTGVLKDAGPWWDQHNVAKATGEYVPSSFVFSHLHLDWPQVQLEYILILCIQGSAPYAQSLMLLMLLSCCLSFALLFGVACWMVEFIFRLVHAQQSFLLIFYIKSSNHQLTPLPPALKCLMADVVQIHIPIPIDLLLF